ncbi:hypothetical protein CR513_58961, partial [Mucuna pruriens]
MYEISSWSTGGSRTEIMTNSNTINQCIVRRCYDQSIQVSNSRRVAYTTLEEQTQVHLLELNPQFDQEDARP